MKFRVSCLSGIKWLGAVWGIDLELSSAKASQKALCVMKLSLL